MLVLLNVFRPHSEMIHTLKKVQLLGDDNSVQIFKQISSKIGELRPLLEDYNISKEEQPIIIETLK